MTTTCVESIWVYFVEARAPAAVFSASQAEMSLVDRLLYDRPRTRNREGYALG